MEDIVATPVLSAEMKNLLLDRLNKEILSKLSGSLCRRGSVSSKKLSGKKRRRKGKDEDPKLGSGSGIAAKASIEKVKGEKLDAPVSPAESVVRSRFFVGINQCTRILENTVQHQTEGQQQHAGSKATPKPSLILLARDVRPATILAHVSLYARLLNVPTLVLPGKASVEMGKAAGVRSAAVAVFLSPSRCKEGRAAIASEGDAQNGWEWKEAQDDVDSFINYVVSKISK